MIRDTSATDRTLSHTERSPMRRNLAFGAVVAALLIAAAITLAPSLTAEHTVSRERLRVVEVKRGTLVRDVAAQGRVVAARSPALYTPAAGIVKFAVEPGASVAKDELLAEIDSPELRSQLKREESTLARAIAERDRQAISNRRVELDKRRAIANAEIAERTARRELERAEWAWRTRTIPEVDLKRAQDTLESASTTLTASRADLNLERDALVLELATYTEEIARQRLLVDELARQVQALDVRAPFAGVVGNWLATDRANVAANQALLTVVDLSELEVEAAVSEVYADSLAPGQSAEVTIGGDRRQGTVRLISPEVQNAQVLTRIRLDAGGAAALRQNQRVQVRVLLEEKPDVLLLERGPALERDQSHAWVLVGDQARRSPVRLGASSVVAFEVLSGLEPGQQIIVAGLDDLPDVETILVTR